MTRIIVRLAVIALTYAVVMVVGKLASGGEIGPNIGLGLAWFAIVAVIALVWAFLDARSAGVNASLVTWLVVAVVAGVGVPLVINLTGAGFDAAVLRSDLTSTGPFIAGLVAVPALIGITAGRLGRS